jgi:hypothetical protein
MFISVLTTVGHWTTWVQCTPSHEILRSILMLSNLRLRHPSDIFSSEFPSETSVCISRLSTHVTCACRQCHPSPCDHPSNTWWRVGLHTMKLTIQFSPAPTTAAPLGPNIPISALFTLNLCSSFGVRDQVSHPYRTTGRYDYSFVF